MTAPLRYRPYLPADRAGLEELFRAVYGDGYRERTSTWRYLGDTGNRPLITVAEEAGRIVGAQPGHGVTAWIGGTAVPAALFVDAMTHPAHRGRGVFAGAVEHLRARCQAEGVRLLLTTPNPVAARTFARLGAWRRLGELTPWVNPVDPRGLAATVPGLHWLERSAPAPGTPEEGVEELDAPPGGMDPAWRALRDATPCLLERDEAAFRWRFDSVHAGPYRFLRHRGSPDRPTVAVVRRRRLLGRAVLLVVDVVGAPGDAEGAARVLRGAARHAAREGLAAVVTFASPGAWLESSLRASGFWSVPRLLRPRGYSIWAALDLAGPAGEHAASLADWYMTVADSDLA